MIIDLKWFFIIVSVYGILRFFWWLWVDDAASLRETKDGDWAARWLYAGIFEKRLIMWLLFAAGLIGSVIYFQLPEQKRQQIMAIAEELLGNPNE